MRYQKQNPQMLIWNRGLNANMYYNSVLYKWNATANDEHIVTP